MVVVILLVLGRIRTMHRTSTIGAIVGARLSVHEEIVDLLWADEIQLLLLNRYPGLSEDQIREAHASAYGGGVIQD